VNTCILYWGIQGAGKRTCVEEAARRLRPGHRGEKREIPTGNDPLESYPLLPIELGQVGGVRTRIDVTLAPGAAEHEPLRRRLLERADGIVLLVDARAESMPANIASLEELRKGLEAYGRQLEDTPLLVQFNKPDHSTQFAMGEALRRMQLVGATAVESVASEGRGVLEGLSTISKQVIRALREQSLVQRVSDPDFDTPAAGPAPFSASLAMERAIRAEAGQPEAESIDAELLAAESFFSAAENAERFPTESPDRPALHIVSVGEATREDASTLRIPLVLGDAEGTTADIALSIRIETLNPDSPR